MRDVVIGPDDPRAPDVTALLGRHLEFSRSTTPPEFVFALDIEALVDPAITFCSARRAGVLVGVGALKELDPAHGELKSMHTAARARGQGVAAALVDHLVEVARRRGYRTVSLETGSQDAFAPARALYAKAGFSVCEAFGDYPESANSVFMRRDLPASG
jgi:putative acetyltransferase